MSTIRDLKIGQAATVSAVGGEGALRQHFLDMGVIPGVTVELIKYAPMGDPIELKVQSYELTLRLADAAKIDVVNVRNPQEAARSLSGIASMPSDTNRDKFIDHPGLGEGGRYHDKKTEHPLPEGTVLTFALAGNQNSGKTTLFNQLTGSNQHVGNFPGVTVDRKDGVIRGHKDTLVTDLPGIYSMSPYTSEEVVSRQFILDEKPKGIINIVDATNIERNLYLTLQLLTLNIPMVVALNMMDEVQSNGGSVNVNRMEQLLGVPVIPISAAKNEGIDELVSHALHVAKYQEKPLRQDFCDPGEKNGAVHRSIHAVMHLIEDHSEESGIPIRFAATKLIEGDKSVIDALKLDENEQETVEHIVKQMEKESGLDRSAAIADMRFNFIEKVVASSVIKPKKSKEQTRSSQIDRILTGKYTAIPMFVLIMALIFYLTFNVIGGTLQTLLDTGITALSNAAENAMNAAGVNSVLVSLVINGVFNGVGSVLSFLPIIVTLFFFLSLLEDSGYMARIAFVMDKILRKLGLSGRSIVPMLIGFGCSVPAVMSSRTLPSERDRKLTVIMIPFMSCSAKLPIYSFFISAFFPGHGAIVMLLLYFTGIAVGILTAVISKNTRYKGEAVPFVMELPTYRMPRPKNVGQLLWEKSKDFIQRAFTVIFIASMVIWFFQTFSPSFAMVSDSSQSMLAILAGFLAPIFAPLGFGDWRMVTALISGFLAKESVVSTLGILFGSVAALQQTLTPATAASFLVFCLLYTPCVAAIASIRRELGRRWAFQIVIFQCVVAWVCAFIVHLVTLLFA
ncbi:MAG: ferrous iron transport protein B [Lachnospiraceae bacterium]|nr:ferrous iron transport protein B [Lachnospiraceae bacterium]MDD7665101.1 ferrous iron transport protein B [Lachnospiraceae bacterium]MDY4165534.1 ferrous iron transport protein B [Lachnospiraceae bacterium]